MHAHRHTGSCIRPSDHFLNHTVCWSTVYCNWCCCSQVDKLVWCLPVDFKYRYQGGRLGFCFCFVCLLFDRHLKKNFLHWTQSSPRQPASEALPLLQYIMILFDFRRWGCINAWIRWAMMPGSHIPPVELLLISIIETYQLNIFSSDLVVCSCYLVQGYKKLDWDIPYNLASRSNFLQV